MFLDEHGRRRLWVKGGGALAGGLCALWLAGLLAGTIGFASLPTTALLARHGGAGVRHGVTSIEPARGLDARELEARLQVRPVHLAAVVRGEGLPRRERS